jgi:putative ABC transport system substrate-binding protein
MIERRAILRAIAAALLTAPFALRAQSPAPRTYRIGFLSAESASAGQPQLDILRKDLDQLGYVEGRNLVIEVRHADGNYDRLPSLAAELVRLKVDVLVTSGSKAGFAAKETTTTTPIVVNNMGDATSAGFVPSYARPGGNVTGLSMMNPEMTTKQLQLLKEIKPNTVAIAVLMNPANPNYALTLAAIRREAASLNVRIEHFDIRREDEFERAFLDMKRAGIDTLLVQSETMFAARAKTIADLAAKHGIAMAGILSYARAGGLVGYSANPVDTWRHVVVYVDRILKGAKPADLPIEQPTKVYLVINLKTAKALGLTIPQSLLVRADEVIQ